MASTSALESVMSDVRRLGLEPNVAELEALGYTVVPPELLGAAHLIPRLRDAVVRVHERRTGEKIDDYRSASLSRTAGAHRGHLLLEDRAFEEVLADPVADTLSRFLCGSSVRLSVQIALLKSRNEETTHQLHTDNMGMPSPWPPYSQTCNVTWVLTDYTRDDGALAVVPGSHKFCRAPRVEEERFLSDDAVVSAVPVECESGSLIVWHGHLWHGAYPRLTAGLRLNLINFYCRPYLMPVHIYSDRVPAELLERNPPSLARLLGLHSPLPYEDAPVPEQMQALIAAGATQWS